MAGQAEGCIYPSKPKVRCSNDTGASALRSGWNIEQDLIPEFCSTLRPLCDGHHIVRLTCIQVWRGFKSKHYGRFHKSKCQPCLQISGPYGYTWSDQSIKSVALSASWTGLDSGSLERSCSDS